MVDDVCGEAFDDVGDAYFSPDSRRLLHMAVSGEKKFVVLVGTKYAPFDQIWGKRFTEDSRFIEYAYRDGLDVRFRREKIK